MESIFLTATLWLALAVVSALIASSLRLSIALVEICVGVAAAAATGFFGLGDVLAANSEWVRFLAASGAVVLTFLAGAELDPDIVRKKLTEVSVVGLVGFMAPFLGCAALAYYVLGWDANASWLCGVALSTTSMAVVYAVMLETGFNKTEFGKGILASCFVTDLGTVIALGLLFAPFTYKTLVFIVGSVVALMALPYYHRVADAALCASYCCDQNEMGHADALWIGRAGSVVGERSGVAGVSRRHGARGKCRERRALDSPAANVDRGISHALLLSSSRNTRVPAGLARGSVGVPRVAHG